MAQLKHYNKPESLKLSGLLLLFISERYIKPHGYFFYFSNALGVFKTIEVIWSATLAAWIESTVI